MSRTIIDARQVTIRSLLQQIANATSYAGTSDAKPANQSELDNLLTAINDELTPLLRMSAASTPSLVVSVGAGIITNSETSYQKALAHVGASLPSFTTGSITFPASSGGTITVVGGNNGTLTVSSGNFIKVTVYLDSSGNLNVVSGVQNAVEASATVAKAPIDTLPLGYITVQNVAGVIQVINQNKIYQFVLGTGVTTSALDTEFVIKDATDPTKQIAFDAAGTTGTKTTVTGSQTVNRVQTLQDVTDTFVYRDSADTLTQKIMNYSSANDAATTGSNATLATIASGVVRLTNASLVSVSGIPSGVSGKLLIVENKTGVQITINNDEATATAANRIFTGTGANVSMPNNATFTFYYDATNSRWMMQGASAATGTGVKNFITGGDAESGTTGWATFADAAASRPVDGTGGSPNVTWATTATSPLIGSNSFLFTKDAANRQGQGVSYDFTIDAAYKAKVLQINMDYIVNSGTFVAGTNTTDSDLIVYLYDVTNSQLIEPSSIKFLSNNSSLSDRFSSTFQTSATGTQYRLILHCASTSASAYVLKFDNISVSPSNYVYGTPITDWQSYTPTFTGLGTVSATDMYWRRVGDTLEVEGRTTPGTTTATGITFSLPSGLSVYSGFTAAHIIGFMNRSAGLSSYIKKWTLFTTANATTISVGGDDNAATTVEPITVVAGTVTSSGQPLLFKAEVRINGWSSSVQMSDQADQRVVGFRARRTTAATAITGTTGVQYDVSWNVTDFDTHGTFNGTTWTCAVAGYYKVNGCIAYAAGSTAGFRAIMFIKNGASASQKRYVPGASVIVDVANDDFLYFNIGDTLKIQAVQNSGTTVALEQADANVNVEQIFSVIRQAGPSAIAATESVNARYSATNGQVLATGLNTLQFPTKNYDSHGAFSSNTIYTAPISGKYRIYSIFDATWSTGAQTNIMYIYKNNAEITRHAYVRTFEALETHFEVQDTLDLIAGDQIIIVFSNGSGATKTINNANNTNYFTIARIGN